MKVFFVSLVFIVGGLYSQGNGYADDTKAFDLKAPADRDNEFFSELGQMHDFMKIEQEKQQKIQLLTLELEQAKLEVALREKMSVLGQSLKLNDKSSTVNSNDNSDPDNKLKAPISSDPSVEVKYTFITKSAKEALLSVDGVEMKVKEGDKIGRETVKSITPNGVVLVNVNEEETNIGFK